MISKDLLQAYLTTEYHVSDPTLTIRINHLHPDLDKFLKMYDSTVWAYITSYNPASHVLPDEENIALHQMLVEDLSGYICFVGYGVGTNPQWKPEQSLLVLGIDQDAAKAIGKKYGQNAIVVGNAGEAATLVLLEPIEDDLLRED